MSLPTETGSGGSRGQAGQGMVEFAMVIPFLMVLFMALLEVALALNASLAINRASQHAAHVAASAGNISGADCLVLRNIETDVGVPNDASQIIDVIIERTALAGNFSYAQQTWSRTGQTACTLPDGTDVNVPYTLITNGYPEAQRCTVLGGCPTMVPPRSTVDNIGVGIRYRHPWVTPLNGALDLIAQNSASESGGWNFTQRNIFRIEPTL